MQLAASTRGLMALWITPMAVAGVSEMARGSKLAGVPSMPQVFQALGTVEWLRHGTGLSKVA
jgi:hypothetical protein